jgi:tetratricopeptide (TPR) repeat protein
MDGEDFSGEDLKNAAEHFGELLDNGESSYRDADELDELIEYFIQEGQLNRAIKAAEHGLEWHPFSALILQRKAYIYHITGRSTDALDLLEKAELFEPNEGSIFSLRGEILSHLEKFDEAIMSFRKALIYSEEYSEIYLNMAFTYQSWNRPVDAIHCLSMIMEDDVENEQILFEIGYCFDLMDNPDEAIRFFEKFIDKHPYSYAAWVNLGNWFQLKEDYEKAIWAYDFGIAILEYHGNAYLQKGLCLFELERYAEAIESFNQTLELDGPDALIYCNIGNCYEELGEIKTSRGFYKLAIKNDATMADAWFGMGITFKLEENYTQAVHFINKAIKLDDEEIDYLIELGEVYILMENYEKAEVTYERICRVEPTLSEAWLDWAMSQFELGKSDEALSTLEDALDFWPLDCRFHYRLAAYYYTLGMSFEGNESLNYALSLNWDEHFLLFVHAPFLQDVESVIETIDLYRH